jgi:hypothetical protein
MIRAMDADAIHREVERRLKLVETLHLRETVWALFSGHIKNYPGWRKKDPEYMCPLVADATQVTKNEVQFSLGNEKWLFLYYEGASSRHSYEENQSEIVGTLALRVNDQLVFEFDIERTTYFGKFDCSTSEHFRTANVFIEGPWTEELQLLLPAIEQHEMAVREARAKKRREDPELLADLKKRFGL